MDSSTEVEEKKPIKQSRWVKKSNVERYSKEQQKDLDSYTEQPGWHKGAKVSRVGS